MIGASSSRCIPARLLVAFVSSIAFPSAVFAQAAAETAEAPSVEGSVGAKTEAAADKPRSGWAGLPIATYSPETLLGLGVFGAHFFRLGNASAQTRPSNIAIVALYTFRSQLITELIPELYWDNDRGHLWSKIDYRVYPNEAWAIGPDAPYSSKETYTERRVRWQGRVGHSLRGPLFLYGHFDLMRMKLSAEEAGGLLARGAMPGARGGISSSLGAALTWDTRDHALVPHTGAYYDVLVSSAQPIFGSKYTFTTLMVDLRNFIPITRTHTLVTNIVFTVEDGHAPFYQLPKLGGPQLLRGYFEGRYRDNTLAIVQAEYRLPLFWRFGAVAFGGVGGVAHTIAELQLNKPRWAVGAGLRILLNRDEKLNLRADLGVGGDTFAASSSKWPERVGFYVSAGEVF